MRKLSIGIMGTRGIPNHYGGFEQFAEYLSEGLQLKGHEVYVYSTSQHRYQSDNWKGVHIIHMNGQDKLGTIGQFLYDLSCINDARKRNFDILLHLGYTSDSIWHWRWPEKTVNILNVDGMEWKRDKYNKLSRRFLKWAESLAAKHAKALVADSLKMQEHFQENYGKPATFIPYGADTFTEIQQSVLSKYKLHPRQYFMLIARMEPENNIEMIIRGYMKSNHSYPLLVVGNISNNYGNRLFRTYHHPNIVFTGPLYNQSDLSNLRYFSARYFHGHSVGGTNPSLLEAMACSCNIVAHENVFNRDVLEDDADYFSSEEQVCKLIMEPVNRSLAEERIASNLHRIETIYSKAKIVEGYEKLMLSMSNNHVVLVKPPILDQPDNFST